MLQGRYEQIENALEATTDTGSFIDLVTSQLRMLRISTGCLVMLLRSHHATA
jgi:hypothetical protein